MGWNGSAAEGKKIAQHKPAKQYSKPRSCGKWLFALAVIVAVAAVSFWFISSKDESGRAVAPAEKQQGGIVEAIPSAAGAVRDKPEKPKKYKDMTNDEKLASIRAKYGDNVPDNMKAIVYFLENPPKMTYHPAKSRESIFKHQSERVIASYVTTEPGTWFMRQPNYDARMDADFAKALSEDIEISDEDSPEDAELKKLVIDTKKELAERVASGEKISDILNEVGKDYYTLGQYKRDLQSQLTEFKKNPDYTDQDIEDYVKAANLMLEKKGLPPLKMPKMVFRHISLKRAEARAKAAAEKENK